MRQKLVLFKREPAPHSKLSWDSSELNLKKQKFSKSFNNINGDHLNKF